MLTMTIQLNRLFYCSPSVFLQMSAFLSVEILNLPLALFHSHCLILFFLSQSVWNGESPTVLQAFFIVVWKEIKVRSSENLNLSLLNSLLPLSSHTHCCCDNQVLAQQVLGMWPWVFDSSTHYAELRFWDTDIESNCVYRHIPSVLWSNVSAPVA